MFFALMEVEEKAKTPANLQLFTPVASTRTFLPTPTDDSGLSSSLHALCSVLKRKGPERPDNGAYSRPELTRSSKSLQLHRPFHDIRVQGSDF